MISTLMESNKMDRRQLLRLTGLAALTHRSRAATSRLETLSEWLRADPAARKRGVELCLERIREMDSSIHAWVQVQPEPPTGQGRLSGIPVGIKDIFETQGLATEFGSAVYKGRLGTSDGAVVRDLRRRGAIVLGKTHTAAFANRWPPPTRNPRDLAHTPGGSSSGSAAAVAAGMIPFATGTQTRGSVLRPASYCGITGFKPTYGFLSTEGVLPLAKSLDTVGFFTHTAADMLRLWECLGNPGGSAGTFPLGVADPVPEVDAEMDSAFRNVVSLLRNSGVRLQPVKIASMLGELDAASRKIMNYEGARVHEERFKQYGSRLEGIADLVRDGMSIPEAQYNETLRLVSRCKQQIAEVFKSTPVILTPAATGPAPLGLASTGDPRMNAPWTALGTPAISIPMPVSKTLPLGLQLTAAHGQDARVLQTAIRLEKILQQVKSPPAAG